MTALLALAAVVAFMAKAGLPWWVVVAVALLMSGFGVGRSGGPGRGSRTTPTSGPAAQPIWPSADRSSVVVPVVPVVPVNVRVPSPDEYGMPVARAGTRVAEERQPVVANGQSGLGS
ncbi:hypothetical protein OG331_10110 [Streptomyces sp. NBC_01017]|uniref:hypothetical protein n=1 Tax=Streptomyces sp. NBC_01017 TaxID=2903721 RepID=UPI00386502F5|nr:hypothetical protein OG331_10110 [Streptomyces sp. NBC_01017]